MQEYLRSTEMIDWEPPQIQKLAKKLALGSDDPVEITKRCFEWVRDSIYHSHDHCLNPITLKASDVLEAGTGYCYAKSHLLAALLRANGIPAGLCYQRLSRDENGEPFCLHGLNAVYLPNIGWYRIDAKGNKKSVNAQYAPPEEILAYEIKVEGEADLPEIWADPLPVIVDLLTVYDSYEDVWENLPDIPLIEQTKK
ncbi:transglutaminase-like domain-containing protein [Methanococcoides alaskense]|uniref:Transglutaminase-like putative cysteine protease n=1 Tax=Methanococcoides alaskense TaxID=325778 RepID=A0AA90Z8U2_9EURY|nr:transglutaminase family protein [Methanococcoides alaskense]MDA0524736.1 transglutaminase family protein [Methanococcoides alaskense]MDR6223144.1 transglutaminase-like putative cysteine protease [Methanococcoides alaskense]